MSNKPPIKTIRDGTLSASIWANSGDKGVFYSVTFARTYTDEAGNPKSTDSFSGGDILKLARLAERAYDRIAELRLADRQQQDAA